MSPALERTVRQVARRCQRREWFRNWVRFGVATLSLLLLFTVALRFFAPAWVLSNSLIAVFVLAEAAAAWRWLYRPLKNPVTLKQVAMYIDEHHPELENRIVSAVEFTAGEHDEVSAWMIERFLEESDLVVRHMSFADLFDPALIRRLGLAAAVLWCVCFALVLTSRHLWMPAIRFRSFGGLTGISSLPFTVEPGDARVRRGDNLVVLVKSDRSNESVAIRWRNETVSWQTTAMDPSSTENVHHFQFANIQNDIDYQVQLGRYRSDMYKITARIPPRMEAINLTYHYPEYLGLDDQEVPNSGDITAVEGSEVDIEVEVNKKLQSAALVLASGSRIELEERMDALWAGRIEVAADDKYHVDLTDLDGEGSEFELVYDITALPDQPPSIKIQFPRGDDEVTALAEVPFDFEVDDEFGIDSYGIQFEVVGREPIRFAMDTPETRQTAAEGRHLMMIENMGLEPGDFITWTVWAKDRKRDRSPYEELGDPYFLEIRPFRRSYEESISNQGGSQRSGRGGEQRDEAASQKDIIIATWNLRRKAKNLAESEFEEQRTSIIEAQEGLADEVAGDGPLTMDTSSERTSLAKAMTRAVDALKQADLPDPVPMLSKATVHEQEAYRLLLKMRPERRRIQQSRSQSGMAGTAGRREINELELDRSRNFYEEEDRTRAEQQANEQTLQSLKELAQRQDIANEEAGQLISELKNAKTEEARQELERRLERLEENLQRNLEQLDEIRRDVASGDMDSREGQRAQQAMNTARREMNRELENVRQDRLQQARSAGSRASQALRDIQRELRRFSRGAAAERLREVQRQMAELRRRQESVFDEVRALGQDQGSQSLDSIASEEEKQAQLLEEKSDLADQFDQMMADAAELAENSQETQRLVARKLNDWLRETSGEGIAKDMRESRPLVQYGIWNLAEEWERTIGGKLEDAALKLDDIANYLVDDDLDALRRARDELRQVLEGDGEERRLAQDGAQEGQQPAEAQTRQPGESEQNDGQPASGTGRDTAGGQSDEERSQTDGVRRGQVRPSRDGRAGINRPDGRAGGGGGEWAPQDMERFIDSDYRRWIESIRNAESLLPDGNANRPRLTGIREDIERMRRDYRRHTVPPQFDMFLDRIAWPLAETAAQIDVQIKAMLEDREFALAREDEVPAQYQKLVADYFRALSEAEGRQ